MATTTWRTTHPLIGRWRATDARRLFLARLACEHDATIGFYSRRDGWAPTTSQRAFLARATQIARRLSANGVEPGDPAIVVAANPETQLSLYVGAVLAGALPSIYPTRPAFSPANDLVHGLHRALSAHGPRARILADGPLRAADDLPPRVVVVVDVASVPTTPLALDAPAIDPDRPLHLQSTSGTTGSGKLATVTHRNLFENVAALLRRFEFTDDDTTVSWLPLYHDMGLISGALLPLLSATDVVLMSPFDFLSDPSVWLQLISDTRSTTSCAPNFAYDFTTRRVRDDRLMDLDLSCWKRACCGGEPVEGRVMRAFYERFAPFGLRRDAIKPGYGLAESTLIVTFTPMSADPTSVRIGRQDSDVLGPVTVHGEASLFDLRSTDATDDDIEVVSAGVPADGLCIDLVDAEGRSVAGDDFSGEIRLRGPSISPGYYNTDGSIERHPHSGMLTGDIGFFHDGQLYILERRKNVIIRNGENYSAALIESELAQALDRPANEVLIIDSDIRPSHGRILVVIGSDKKEDFDALNRQVRAAVEHLELRPDELVVVPRGAVPRTTSGKKQHAGIRELLRNDDIRVLARFDLLPRVEDPPPPQPIVIDIDEIDAENRVRAIIESLARARGVTSAIEDTTTLVGDLAFDSLTMFEMAVAIEDELDLVVPEDAVADLQDVHSVLDLVGRLRKDPHALREGIRSTIEAVQESIPQLFSVVEDQKFRDVLIGGRWIADFASCNYLGLDLHPQVVEAVKPAIERWGVHPSWTRAVASPGIYRELERALAAFVGAPDTLVFPTVTLTHLGLLPILAPAGAALVLDIAAHHSMHEAAQVARARGAHVYTYPHGDYDQLARLLERESSAPARVIVVDGVYSMSGSLADLPRLVGLADRFDAQIYVDDAHGIGIIGEDPTPTRPWGRRGNGVVQHFGVEYHRIIYVAGLSKAFSSMAAFVTCRNADERRRFANASTAVFSGPVPTASLASALAGLRVNDRDGESLRAELLRLTRRLITGARELGFTVDNRTDFPIVTVVLGGPADVQRGCHILWEHGVLLTPALFPAVPLNEGGLRFTLTAANTDDQIDRVLVALADVRADLEMLKATRPRAAVGR